VHKRGAWSAYQEDRIGQGREHAKKYLKEHPEVAAAIEQQLRQTLGLVSSAAEPPAGADLKGELWDHEGEEA
jgi:recombination protein RecA